MRMLAAASPGGDCGVMVQRENTGSRAETSFFASGGRIFHHRLAGADVLPLLPTGGEGRGEEATFIECLSPRPSPHSCLAGRGRKKPRHLFSNPTVRLSEDPLAGGVGVKDNAVVGHAEDGVWILRGESAQNSNRVRDTLAFRDHPTSAPQRPLDDLTQLLRSKPLEQVIEGPVPQTVDRSLGIPIASQHDHRYVRRPWRQLTQKVEAGFACPKLNAAQHQLGRVPPEGLAGAGKIPGFSDMMPRGFQRQTQERARVRTVFDDEDAGGSQSRWRLWSHGSA